MKTDRTQKRVCFCDTPALQDVNINEQFVIDIPVNMANEPDTKALISQIHIHRKAMQNVIHTHKQAQKQERKIP